MTLKTIVRPVFSLSCDNDGCPEEFRGDCEWSLRREAKGEGWSVRPNRGKGSRSAPDLCPEHAEQAEAVSRG